MWLVSRAEVMLTKEKYLPPQAGFMQPGGGWLPAWIKASSSGWY
jgi:hypothetical protein